MPRLVLLLLSGLWVLPAFAAADKSPPLGEAFVYKTVEQTPLKLFVVKPSTWKASDRRPALVFFHGGGWVGGPVGQFNQHCLYFASRGLVCIQVEYRLVPNKTTVPPVVCIEDARSAFRWVRSHAESLGIDPSRIAACGGSAGGHLAAHLGLVEGTDDPGDDLKVSVKPQALILFNPVLDNSQGNYGAERVGARWRELSPAQNVTAGAPPAIIFLGREDKLIPTKTMESFRDAMTRAGVRCDLHLYPGVGHGFFNETGPETNYYALTVLASDEFLTSLGWLRGDATLPVPAGTGTPASAPSS